MIGNPKWFRPRKYTGWGVTPVTWQGLVYVIALIIPLIAFHVIYNWDTSVRIIVTGAWLAFILFDVFDIMTKMKTDEREKKLEAISERNAAWAMIAVLIIAVLYQAFTSALNQSLVIDWFLIAALIGGVIAKGVSNFVLARGEL